MRLGRNVATANRRPETLSGLNSLACDLYVSVPSLLPDRSRGRRTAIRRDYAPVVFHHVPDH